MYCVKNFTHTHEGMLDAMTILIPKISGMSDPAKHRTITLASVVVRCFHSVLTRFRFSEGIQWSSMQRAFLAGDGGAESVFTIRRLIHLAKAGRRPIHFAFVDVSKAFDSVSHDTMLVAVERLGVPGPPCGISGISTRMPEPA